MKIRILAVGRLKAGAERDLFSHYLTRFETLARTLGISAIEVIELSESRASHAAQRLAEEGQRLRQKQTGKGVTIALDENGRAITSMGFAAKLTGWRHENQPAIEFIFGGADGLLPEIKANAQFTLSLSAMTLPHGLARIILAEQLYRAATIANGHPYHRH